MYILIRVIALQFHCALSVWRAFSRGSQIKSSCTSDSKLDIFPWLSNIYRWIIYL